MKKVLLSLLAAFTLAANAQNDISVTVDSPASGFTLADGVAFDIDFTVTNVGPNTIEASDSVYFRLFIGGYPIILSQGAPAETMYHANREDNGSYHALGMAEAFTYSLTGVSFADVSTFETSDVCVLVGTWDDSEGTWMVESDSMNNIACNQVTPIEPVGINEIDAKFSTYPNPVLNVLNVDLTVPNAVINISDISGRVVLTTELVEGNNQINVANLAVGNYIFSVMEGNTFRGSGKFVK